MVEAFLASPKITKFRNAKHKQQWARTLGALCADFRGKFVDEIQTGDVINAIEPIWARAPETGRRLLGRIEKAIGFATVRNWRVGDNPARWRGHLETHFVARGELDKGQHASMPWRDVPAFYAGLPDTVPGLALRFLILTATRLGEMLGATWDEISDLDGPACMWTIQARRMKRGKTHEIPLAGAAVDLLRRAAKSRVGNAVFPGRLGDKPISDFAVRSLLVEGATLHGMRASFKTWAAEAGVRREIAEVCLAHAFGDATERTYQRSNFLAERRAVMQRYADMVTGKASS